MTNDEATLDLNQFLSCVNTLKDSIRDEQQKAQREIFRSFMGEVLKIDSSDDVFAEMESNYIEELNALADDDIPLSKRVLAFVESPFLYDLLTYKNLRYEREIKSFLKNLQVLLTQTSRESSDSDVKFIHSFLERGLNDVVLGLTKENLTDNIPQDILSTLIKPIDTWFKGSRM